MGPPWITREYCKKTNKYLYFYPESSRREVVCGSIDYVRICRLRIPPCWKEVRVSCDATSHLQVRGRDRFGDVQYIYHPLWVEMTKYTKYDRLKRFCVLLPSFMKRLYGILSSQNVGSEVVLAVMFVILYKTYIRVGSEDAGDPPRACGKTFGLTTLENKHVILRSPDKVWLVFRGKRGVLQNLYMRDRAVYGYLESRKKSLGEGDRVFGGIGARVLNQYVEKHLGRGFTCKDFRTWGANRTFFDLARAAGSNPPGRSALVRIVAGVAERLGNTPAVCRTSYISDNMCSNYLKGVLDPRLENNL